MNLRVKEYWTDSITVVWDPPKNDGGTPITGYLVEKRDASRPTWVKAADLGPEATDLKATNLFEGSEYVFRVYSANMIGQCKKPAELERPCKAKMPFGKSLILSVFISSS